MTEWAINPLDPTLLNSIFRFVTPILLAALGGLLCDRVGVFNIALEGMLLTGAFTAVVGSYYFESSLAGVLAAMLGGAAVGLIFALLTVTFRADMIVVGIAINLFASGTTIFLLRSLFGVKGAFQDPRIQGLAKIDIPVIDEMPVLGPLISDHTWLVYLSWLLVIGLNILLFRHALGLRLRGVGERPQAAATLGIDVPRLRYGVILVSGLLCGLGGAQLALGNVTLFVEDMSAGRGWIAVVAVMLGQAHPLGVFAASTLFGFVDSLSFRIQGLGLPSQFTEMLPYVVTLLSLIAIAFQRQRRRRLVVG